MIVNYYNFQLMGTIVIFWMIIVGTEVYYTNLWLNYDNHFWRKKYCQNTRLSITHNTPLRTPTTTCILYQCILVRIFKNYLFKLCYNFYLYLQYNTERKLSQLLNYWFLTNISLKKYVFFCWMFNWFLAKENSKLINIII